MKRVWTAAGNKPDSRGCGCEEEDLCRLVKRPLNSRLLQGPSCW